MRGKAALAGFATAVALAAPAQASGPAQRLEGTECFREAGVGTGCLHYRVVSHIAQTPSGRMAVHQTSRQTQTFVGEGRFVECRQVLRAKANVNYLLTPDENGDGLGETRVYHFVAKNRYAFDCSAFGLPRLSCISKVKYLVIGGAVRQDDVRLDCEPLEGA